MKIEKDKEIVLSWKTKFGLFTTKLYNNKITDMKFLRKGIRYSSGLELYEHDIEFLEEVHKAIGETLNYIKNN